tara:strand:- start:668 stop:823 length:156 start_codon:yes stop_codon:yes gene_type:complete
MVAIILWLFFLPFLAWSWFKKGLDEDANATLSIVAWVFLIGTIILCVWLLF